MATKLLFIDELDRRHVAVYEEYLRDHAPGYPRRQVFTGHESQVPSEAGRAQDVTVWR
jgi:hypothetical protein